MKQAKGFTLIELMITIAVTMLLLVAVYVAINAVQQHASGIERKVTAQQDAKPALDLMALEISMASYNPTFATNIWVNPTGACTAAAANQNYRGIQEATANSIVVEMDIRGPAAGSDGDGMLGDPNEVVRYNYDTVNAYITRETNCGGGQPFLGDTAASANPRTVRVINATLGLPIFQYFDGSGAQITIGTLNNQLPLATPNIRRIQITLAVETEDIDPTTGQRRRLIYSTSVNPRNH